MQPCADGEKLELCAMTRPVCHALFREWENDPALYADASLFKPYVYDPVAVDRYFDSRQESSRVMLAVLLNGSPVGEIQLKRIDRERGECTLSIHMQKDAYKNRGYGTQAERLAVRFAFEELHLTAVLADALVTNTRSRHVLEKAGFRPVGQNGDFVCYRMEKNANPADDA